MWMAVQYSSKLKSELAPLRPTSFGIPPCISCAAPLSLACVAYRFVLVQKHTVEFNQLAMANSEGSEAMLNRVMTKDNIGVAVLLELRKEMMEQTGGSPALCRTLGVVYCGDPGLSYSCFPAGKLHGMEKQLLLVANAHMHWDPEYSDVKLVQTMMFLSEIKNIIDNTTRSLKLNSISGETNTIPLVLCADLNSLPDSGKFFAKCAIGISKECEDLIGAWGRCAFA